MDLQMELPPNSHAPLREVDVVHFAGANVSLQEDTLDQIRDQLLALADEPNACDVVLDFANVQYVTSTLLNTLVRLRARLRATDRRIAIGNLCPEVREVFAVTHLDRLFPVHRDDPGNAAVTCQCGAGVLVIDDDCGVRNVLALTLDRHGYRVWTAGNGLHGSQLFQRHLHEIDWVLLDVGMPGLDGPHTLALLQRLSPNVHCCFMTGDSAVYTDNDLSRLGAARVLRKPFAFGELMATLRQSAPPLRRQRRDRWLDVPRKGA